ncbi:hypothetical protein [Deefgea sp. CFH1-16]|uniref:hypothetical protein n=1 Tax=Deefgea sp. CFH1-16 TaxID=2675457 RepID=UPI0015F3D3F0|nr:hypothetical protein [Deefgea sp. CFH1-16]MBM5574773.1 hypothetical protein [Deefgea sp. CFH1-16]
MHNADAETTSPSGNAAGWNFDHWTQGEPASQASRDSTVSHSGSASLKISLPQGDDGKLIQAVPVEPNTWYRLSAWVKTVGIPNAVKTGANLSVIDAMEFVGDIKGDQDWQQIVAWGQTGPEQKEIKIAARLGFYGSLATGTVWFDDISLSQSEPPAGAKIISFMPPPPAPAATTSSSAALVNSVVIGASLAFLLLAWLAIQNRSVLNHRFADLANGTLSWQQTASALTLIAVVIFG